MPSLESKLSTLKSLQTDELSDIIREYIQTQCMVHDIMLVSTKDLTQEQIDKITPEHIKRTERLSKLIANAVIESLELDFETLKILIYDKLGDIYKASNLAQVIRLSLWKFLNFKIKREEKL